MAELHVEKKKKSPIGWIILGVIVLGLIIWFVASETNGTQEVAQFRQNEEQTSEYGREQSQAVPPFDNDDRYRDRTGDRDRDMGRTASDRRIQEFLVFVDERTDDMTTTKTREGLIKLSDALIAVSEQSDRQGAWQGELEQIKQQANRLQDNMTEQHSAVIQSAFSSAANVIQDIQNKYYPGLENDASDVMDAAQDIETQELASEQENEIKSFFNEAADVVRKMDERRQTSSIQ
jgi:hypothetical protein